MNMLRKYWVYQDVDSPLALMLCSNEFSDQSTQNYRIFYAFNFYGFIYQLNCREWLERGIEHERRVQSANKYPFLSCFPLRIKPKAREREKHLAILSDFTPLENIASCASLSSEPNCREYAISFIPLECNTRILIDSVKRGVGTAVNRVHLKAHLLPSKQKWTLSFNLWRR